MLFYRSHGITRNTNLLYLKDQPNWYYEQQVLGYNYRLNDIQAALGISQIKRLEKFVLKRNNLVNYYKEKLSGLPIIFQKINGLSAYHLFVIQLKTKTLAEKRDEIFVFLRKKYWSEFTLLSNSFTTLLQNLGFKKGDFPNSESYANRAITLPLYPKLKIKEIDYIIKMLKEMID